MTQLEAINLFRNKATKYGFIADSSRYPNRRILADLKLTIAAIKKAKIDAKQELAPHDIITLPCVEMKQADRVECPNVPPSGLMWIRSVDPLPRYLKILDVTTVLGDNSISITPWNRLNARTASRSQYVQSRPMASFKNIDDKVYLFVLNSSLEAMSIVFVPEDFQEALEFPKCGTVDQNILCNPLTLPIGADFDTLDKASDILVKKEAQIFSLAMGSDVDANGKPVN